MGLINVDILSGCSSEDIKQCIIFLIQVLVDRTKIPNMNRSISEIGTSPEYSELQKIYSTYFSLKYLGTDVSNKFALISLVCWLVDLKKKERPDVTHWQILYKINKTSKNPMPEDMLKSLAVVCSDFSYNCTKFPTFNIPEKEIPKKIRELLEMWLPF